MKKKFIASYSGGKDSILAIHRAVKQGFEPIALIITFNTDKKRSWFHAIPESILNQVAKSINIPVWLIETNSEKYKESFEKALARGKAQGAEICIFGDIDVEAHRVWCSQRCENTGLEPMFPLWGENRKQLVEEFIDCGYTANFTVIDTKRLTQELLGEKLDRNAIEVIEKCGADPCGENGEYHTFVSDGPLFTNKITLNFGEKTIDNGYAVLDFK